MDKEKLEQEFKHFHENELAPAMYEVLELLNTLFPGDVRKWATTIKAADLFLEDKFLPKKQ